MRWLMAAGLMLPAVAAYAQAGNPGEVSPKDWSYQAIADFANRGLVNGYKDAKFLEGRKLTRFEMATLVKRVMDALLELPDPDKLKGSDAKPTPAAVRGQGIEAPPSGRPVVSKETRARVASWTEADLGTVKRLSDTYAVELAVIGVNLQETMDKLTDLEGRVETIEARLSDPEGPLQTVINNVTRIDKIRLSGYIQARFQSYDQQNERDPDGSGPLQEGVTNSFHVRRMRLNVAWRPTDHISGRFSFDGGGNGGASLSMRDAYAAYHLKGDPVIGPSVWFGQMNAPFGFEVEQSSGVRETPERSRIVSFYFRDERDRGIKLASATGAKYLWDIGVYNGINAARSGRNNDDNNTDKDVIARVRTTTLNNRLDLGISGVFGRSANGTGTGYEEHNRRAIGAHLQWFPLDGTTVRFEGIWGEDLGHDVNGWYATVIQNVGKKWQGVARYEWIGTDGRVPAFPVNSAGTQYTQFQAYNGTASALELGAIYYIDASTKLKFFWEKHNLGREEVAGKAISFHGDLIRFEVVTVF